MYANYAELTEEVRSAIRTRALRMGMTLTTNEPKISVVLAGVAMGNVPSGKTCVILEFDNTLVPALTEKLSGIKQDLGTLPS